jgi:hypothetical protein
MLKPLKSPNQGDADDPAQTSKEELAKIAENAPSILPMASYRR